MAIDLRPLFPTFADPRLWRDGTGVGELSSEQWAALREKVLTRDDYTCQYCGHRAHKYQVVHHIDENPRNNSEENLAVICQLCNVIVHSGQGCVVQGVVDLYGKSRFSQVDIIRTIWRMRFREGKDDRELLDHLGLEEKVPFRMDKQYLRRLYGFVTSRLSRQPDNMYENWRRWQTRMLHSRWHPWGP